MKIEKSGRLTAELSETSLSLQSPRQLMQNTKELATFHVINN